MQGSSISREDTISDFVTNLKVLTANNWKGPKLSWGVGMSLEPSASPKTYQDVKTTLRWYTFFASIPVAIFLYFFLVPISQRKQLEAIFSIASASPFINSIGAAAFITGSFVFLSWFLVFIFEIHDKVYDRYFIRWRYFYDLDFILPTLTRPFGPALDPRFFEAAGQYLYQFMKPYYHFVADGEHEHKISENLILRFYEAVTKYWITQINEVLLIAALIIDFVYFWIYRHLNMDFEKVSLTLFIVVVCGIVNRAGAQLFLKSVRRATLDEIEDIHSHYVADLETELKKTHEKFNLKWRV
jgi:hypothetical protein